MSREDNVLLFPKSPAADLKADVEQLAAMADDAERFIAVREVAARYKGQINLSELRLLVQTKRREQAAPPIEQHQESIPIEEQPWHEPVDLGVLLSEMNARLHRHLIIDADVSLVSLLWAVSSWVQEIATHHPILLTTSPTPGAGKSTLLGILRFITCRGRTVGHLTAPNIYRIVDEERPTLIVEEGDNILKDPDIATLFNLGWTRDAVVPRQVYVDGNITTRNFQVSGPKAIAMNPDKHTGKLNADIPTLERSIVIHIKKKLPTEKVEPFNFKDDAEFVTFRQKLARWAQDNMSVIEAARPVMPTGVDGRIENNWRIITAIADMAGGSFPKRARAALVRLTPRDDYNASLRLLEAVYWLFVGIKPETMPAQFTVKRTRLASHFIVKHLNADKTGEWCEFDGRGRPITQRGVARLLRPYGIHSETVHPTKKANQSPRGYKVEDFIDAFARYLPNLPTLVIPPARRKRRKPKAKHKKARR
jgi:putative DNA primase/helicase